VTKASQKQDDETRLKEKMRLLYVALTRAEKHLFLIGSVSKYHETENDKTESKQSKWRRPFSPFEVANMFDIIRPQNPHIVFIANITNTILPQKETISHEEKQQSQQKIFHEEPQGERPFCEAKLGLNFDKTHDDFNVLAKRSVTSLTQTEEHFADYITPKFLNPADTSRPIPHSFQSDRGGSAEGTKIHKQFQYGELPAVVANFVADCKLYKEIPFIYEVEGTLVQGIIDLLAVKNGQKIVIDYKTTRGDEMYLKSIYQKQLFLYKEAVGADYAYIFSTRLNKLIQITHI
jgi:ATP-dependent exoDNAse (exonuclease V) beta subunit